MLIRLDKLLCEMGFGSRSDVKSAIKKGSVTVNEEKVSKSDIKIDTDKDHVKFMGEEVSYSRYEYYMFHKPAGCVSATKDKRDKTVLDYFKGQSSKELFPVGRLDKDTEGLLIITNDGELAHALLSPRKHVAKTYYAELDGSIDEDTVKMFAEGIDIGDDKATLPAKLEIIESGEGSKANITIVEGRYHQVKRMFLAVGCKVLYLKRLSMGGVWLDDSLTKGQFRPLSEDELMKLKKNE